MLFIRGTQRELFLTGFVLFSHKIKDNRFMMLENETQREDLHKIINFIIL